MGKGVTYDSDVLKILFTATAIANVADNAASSPLTNLFVALHTADPSAGNQNTSEVAYTGYNRVAVARNSSGWTVTGNSSVNAANINFPPCTGGSNTAAFFSIGKNNTGTAGEVYYAGALNSNLAISSGITPSFGAGNCACTEA